MRRDDATMMRGGDEHMVAEVIVAEGPRATAVQDKGGLGDDAPAIMMTMRKRRRGEVMVEEDGRSAPRV